MKKLFSMMIALALLAGCMCGVTSCSSAGGSKADMSLLAVKMGDKWGYIDHEGKFVINPQFSKADCFYDGLARVCLDGKYGYIDKNGNYVITPQYADATRFSEGIAWVVSPDGPLCLIDKSGEVINVRRDLLYAYPFSEGVSIAKGYGDKYYIVDKIGNTLHTVSEGLRVQSDFRDGLAQVTDQEYKDGYINQQGELVIPCTFRDAKPFVKGQAIVEVENDRWGTIDKNGNYVINPQFDRIAYSDGDSYVIKVGSQHGWCDRAGKITINPQFDEVIAFWGGDLAPVVMGNKIGYVDQNGKLQINPQFDGASPFLIGSKLAWVFTGGKWGLIDTEGKYVVNPQFDEISLDLPSEISRARAAYSENFYVEGVAAHVKKLLEGNCFDGMKITQTSITDFRKKYGLSGNATSKEVNYSRDVEYTIRAVGTFSRRVSDGWWGTQLEQLPNAKLDAVRLTLETKEEKNLGTLFAELRKVLGSEKGQRDGGQYFELSRVGAVITLTVSDKPLN